MTPGETIDVCVCTFRRASLRETLRSIADQHISPAVRLRVIVADNDETDTRRPEIIAAAHELSLDLIYVHAPFRNISTARNACLDAAGSDWVAFVDDDEIAQSDWIVQLMACRENVEFVFGVSKAGYADERIPSWVVEGDYHSNRIGRGDGAWNGYTANVLMDRRFVEKRGLRFLDELGQTGGEDTMFFSTAHRAGARFAYAPDAVVDEEISLSRANFAWLARRRYRSGQTHALINAGAGTAMTALAKAAACFAQAIAFPFAPRFARKAALRGLLHAGVVASALGFASHREYGEPPSRRSP